MLSNSISNFKNEISESLRICISGFADGRHEVSPIARKLSKLEPKVQLRNFPSVEQIQDGSFERFPTKSKKLENSLKLPGVLFSISLIIYTENYHFK